jgi:ABC-2 type transport system ATP-binding protein
MMIRALADDGVTVIFSTHVIHHAERLCEGVAIIAGGKVPYAGSVEEARDRIPAQVRLETRAREGAWASALPPETRRNGDFFQFPAACHRGRTLAAAIDRRRGRDPLALD